MESTKYLSEAHAEHHSWIEIMNFYLDELGSFKTRLEEVAILNESREVNVQIEHFQNQFIRQREVIDILKHEINVLEEDLLKKVLINPIATDRRRILDETGMREKIEVFEKIFLELKIEFKQFLSSLK